MSQLTPFSRRAVLKGLSRVAAGAALLPALPPALQSAAQVPALPAPSETISGSGALPSHAAAYGLLAGCAVAVGRLDTDQPYTDLVLQQAGIVVAENDMKWAPLRPTATTFNFAMADRFVNFAQRHSLKARGHNLCWHRQLPGWFKTEATTGNARQLLADHIATVAGRYRGRIHSWDVVNEAVQVSDGRPDGLRNSPWLQLIGPEYLELAFHQARLADPDALLTYNDYGIESEADQDEQKRQAVLSLLKRLKSRGAPLDAVGIQAHISAGAKHHFGPGLTRFMKECQALGLQILITEMDVNDRDLPPDNGVRDREVAARYGQFLDVVLANPEVKAVLTWGITDRYTWLNGEDSRPDHLPERCLPFDAALQPVPAFFAIRDAFDRRRG